MKAVISVGVITIALGVAAHAQDAAAGRYSVEWIAVDVPAVMEAGRDQMARVTFRNTGNETWPAGTVYASYHWYKSGAMLPGAYETPQTRIPFPIAPGQEATVEKLLILPPAAPGRYDLRVTLVDRTAWFENKGAKTVVVPVSVAAGQIASPFLTEEMAGRLSPALWLFLALTLVGATLMQRRARRRLVLGFLTASAVTALVLAALPVIAAPARHLATQPFPDSAEYADAARHLVQGDGYVTTAHGGDAAPPLYPPGFSTALAMFALSGEYPENVQIGTKWFALAYVVAATSAAWYLGGPVAAIVTSLVVGFSPFARTAGTLVLADAFSVALLLVLVMLIARVTMPRALIAGLMAGILVAVRLNMAMALIAATLAVPFRYWKAIAIGAAPVLAALAVYHWLTFGHPLTTGYDFWVPNLTMFDVTHPLAEAPRPADGVGLYPDRMKGQLMQWVCPCPGEGPQAALPNVWFYPFVISGLFWVFTPPLITLAGLAWAWRRRADPGARFTLLLTAFTVLVFTFYYYQAARFVAGPATLLGIYGAVAIVETFRRKATKDTERLIDDAVVSYQPRVVADVSAFPVPIHDQLPAAFREALTPMRFD